MLITIHRCLFFWHRHSASCSSPLWAQENTFIILFNTAHTLIPSSSSSALEDEPPPVGSIYKPSCLLITSRILSHERRVTDKMMIKKKMMMMLVSVHHHIEQLLIQRKYLLDCSPQQLMTWLVSWPGCCSVLFLLSFFGKVLLLFYFSFA